MFAMIYTYVMKFLYAIFMFISGCTALTYTPSEQYLIGMSNQVNNNMTYMSDSDNYGISDKWVPNCPKSGDCEDYALCKLKHLKESGYDKSKIGILVVEDTFRKMPHAVTIVEPDIILDNLTPSFKKFNTKEYIPYYVCYLDGSIKIFVKNVNGDIKENRKLFLKQCKVLKEI